MVPWEALWHVRLFKFQGGRLYKHAQTIVTKTHQGHLLTSRCACRQIRLCSHFVTLTTGGSRLSHLHLRFCFGESSENWMQWNCTLISVQKDARNPSAAVTALLFGPAGSPFLCIYQTLAKECGEQNSDVKWQGLKAASVTRLGAKSCWTLQLSCTWVWVFFPTLFGALKQVHLQHFYGVVTHSFVLGMWHM